MILFYLSFLIFVTSAEKIENMSGEDVLLRYKDFDYKERTAYENHKLQELLRNPDENDIERPCEVYDKYCIRKFLTEHSRCKAVYGPMPNPLYRAQTTFHVPRVNLSITSNDLYYYNLDGKIEEFYINRRTDKLVLTIEFQNFISRTNAAYFRFHRVGKEPIVNRDFFYVYYASMIQTIIIPNLKNLLFEDSEVFTFTNDILSPLLIGPSAFSGTDPVVQETALAFFTNVPADDAEVFFLEGLYYIQSFVQYTLCDFELLLT